MKFSLLSRLSYAWLFGVLLSSVSHAALQNTASTHEAPRAQVIHIAAAQRVYADVIEQLGGPYVQVATLASQPNQDPHMLAITPKVGRDLAAARLVVYNGAAYDAWLTPLLAASHAPHRAEIAVAALINKRAGDNPHIWYLPEALRALARAVHTFLLETDPAHTEQYDARLQHFLASLEPIQAQIAVLRTRYQGVPVTATEPVFEYMAQAIGLQIRQQSFQRAVMMEAQPSARDVLSFQTDLQQQRVKLLIYNTQTSGDMARHMLALARASHIPVLLITETLPEGQTYQAWILKQLQTLDQCLALPSSVPAKSGATALQPHAPSE